MLKILSLFIHSHIVPNHYDILSSVKHKRGYAEKCLKSMVTKAVCLPKIPSLKKERKILLVWNDIRASE